MFALPRITIQCKSLHFCWPQDLSSLKIVLCLRNIKIDSSICASHSRICLFWSVNELLSSATLGLNVGLVHNMHEFNDLLFVTLFPLARFFIPTIATNPKNYVQYFRSQYCGINWESTKTIRKKNPGAFRSKSVHHSSVSSSHWTVFSVVTCLQCSN